MDLKEWIITWMSDGSPVPVVSCQPHFIVYKPSQRPRHDRLREEHFRCPQSHLGTVETEVLTGLAIEVGHLLSAGKLVQPRRYNKHLWRFADLVVEPQHVFACPRLRLRSRLPYEMPVAVAALSSRELCFQRPCLKSKWDCFHAWQTKSQ